MAHIHLIGEGEAHGPLRKSYDAAVARAGRVWNIVKTMSPNPAVLDASMNLYLKVMHGSSTLTRAQRELIAVAVSMTNDCFY